MANYIECAYFEDGYGLLCGQMMPKESTVKDLLVFLEKPLLHEGLSIRQQAVHLDTVLSAGDRLEISPSLLVDYKEKRRRLVASRKEKK